MVKLLILLFFSWNCFGVETEGQLTFPNVKEITVGETTNAQLLLLPFEERLLTPAALEGKDFLGLFYIVQVNQIKTSENNFDAVLIDMDIILPQKFEPQELYVWQLGDRNIPIKIEMAKINNVTLNAKDFIVYSGPAVDFDEFSWKFFGLLLSTTLLLAGGVLLLNKSRRKKSTNVGTNYAHLLATVKGHDDLEKLYRERRELFRRAAKEELKQRLNQFFERYERDQYKKTWREKEIAPILEEAKEISKELGNGV